MEIQPQNINPSQKQRREKAEEFRLLGNSYVKEKKFTKALEEYSTGLKYFESAALYSNRAQCYKNLNEFQYAIEDCTKALEINCLYVKCYYRRALIYESLEKWDEAFEDVCIAFMLFITNDTIFKALGRILSKKAVSIFKNMFKTTDDYNLIISGERIANELYHMPLIELPKDVLNAKNDSLEYKLQGAVCILKECSNTKMDRALEILTEYIQSDGKYKYIALDYRGLIYAIKGRAFLRKAPNDYASSLHLNPTTTCMVKAAFIASLYTASIYDIKSVADNYDQIEYGLKSEFYLARYCKLCGTDSVVKTRGTLIAQKLYTQYSKELRYHSLHSEGMDIYVPDNIYELKGVFSPEIFAVISEFDTKKRRELIDHLDVNKLGKLVFDAWMVVHDKNQHEGVEYCVAEALNGIITPMLYIRKKSVDHYYYLIKGRSFCQYVEFKRFVKEGLDKQYEGALEYQCLQMLKLDPYNLDAFKFLGLYYLVKTDYHRASAFLRNALDIYNDDFQYSTVWVIKALEMAKMIQSIKQNEKLKKAVGNDSQVSKKLLSLLKGKYYM